MMKDKIVSLLKDVNSKFKNKTLSKILLEKVNLYHSDDVSESEIFNKLLDDISGINSAVNNKEVSSIVESYAKFKQPKKFTITNMANEAGLFKLLTGIRASNSFADPVIKQAVSIVENNLSSYPEFRVLPSFIETLKNFSYDSNVKKAVNEAQSYLTKNSAKILLLNSIYELRLVPTNTYSSTIAILEQSLLDNQFSHDALKMKLHESAKMPIVQKMLNTLAMVESKNNSTFNLGNGSHHTTISPLIAPSIVTNESSIITVLDNRFVEIKKDGVTFMEPKTIFENHSDFYNYTINFSKLGFKPSEDGIKASFRKTNIEFKNEGATVSAFINRNKIDPKKAINYSELFLLESIDSKNSVSSLFEKIDFMTSLDFIKNIATSSKTCSVVSIDKNLFVIENNNSGQVLQMNALQFVKYIKENYGHDTTELFTDELDQTTQDISSIDDSKRMVNDDIAKLDQALNDVDTSIQDTEDEAVIEAAMDLRFKIEKSINTLREKFIQLESDKQRLLEHNIVSTTKRYNMNDNVQTKDGRFGKVRGVDTSTGRYMVAFEDNKVLPVTESELV